MRFGFLVFPGLEELDLVGPWEIVAEWSKRAQGPEERLLVAERPGPVRCANGMVIEPHVAIPDCPPLDYLLVPGGEGVRTAVDNEALVGFVARQAVGCAAVLSVCTGSFLLHRAGLLHGRRATTHWTWLDRMRALGDVEVVEERVVRDGVIWTAAGISAGIDLALAFVAEVAGEDAAGRVQLAAEYYPSGRIYGGLPEAEKVPRYLRAQARP